MNNFERSEVIKKMIRDPKFTKSEPIYEAMDKVYDEFKKAEELDYIKKPIAYALYQVWKQYDMLNSIKNGREK